MVCSDSFEKLVLGMTRIPNDTSWTSSVMVPPVRAFAMQWMTRRKSLPLARPRRKLSGGRRHSDVVRTLPLQIACGEHDLHAAQMALDATTLASWTPLGSVALLLAQSQLATAESWAMGGTSIAHPNCLPLVYSRPSSPNTRRSSGESPSSSAASIALAQLALDDNTDAMSSDDEWHSDDEFSA